jgi:hypothetical protein
MTVHHVLIDYENVQPKNVEALKGHPVRVILFVGANQTKVPFELAAALQALGEHAEYRQISGSGRNALDFHVAFHLGELIERNPDDVFHIISKDTGFDPLIRHLESRGIKAKRSRDLTEIPFLQIPAEKSDEEKIAAIVKNLTGRAQSRPRRVRTLANMINSLFAKNLSEAELMRIVDLLREQGHISIDGSKVSYEPAERTQ